MGKGKVLLEHIHLKFKERRPGKDRLLILFLAGLLLLVVSLPMGKKEEEVGQRKEAEVQGEGDFTVPSEEYALFLEERLEEVLSQIEGAGEVSVMVTLQSTAEKVVEKDMEEDREVVTEEDSQGGSRTTRSTSRREEALYDERERDGQSPYVRKELSPKVEGVVIICPGGEDAVVIKNITEAVQALFGIDTHKIRIVKGRRER